MFHKELFWFFFRSSFNEVFFSYTEHPLLSAHAYNLCQLPALFYCTTYLGIVSWKIQKVHSDIQQKTFLAFKIWKKSGNFADTNFQLMKCYFSSYVLQKRHIVDLCRLIEQLLKMNTRGYTYVSLEEISPVSSWYRRRINHLQKVSQIG